jgi:Fe-S cluster assembly protein SufD
VTAGIFDAAAAKALGERNGDPSWLIERRLEALERFEALPWPDPSTEAWRYTELKGFNLGDVHAVVPPHSNAPTLDQVPEEVQAAIGEVGERAGFAVQLDADVVHLSLDPALKAKGVVFDTIGNTAGAYPDPVRDAMGSAGVSESEEKFATLATAFASGGAYIYVPRGVEVAVPLQSFRWITRAGVAVFPRTVIVAEEGASVTYIDHYRSGALDGPALAAASVEIYAHQASNVSYLAVQDWAPTVWHFNIQRALVQRDATLRSLAATLGGHMSRSVVESILDGPGAHSEMLGVYFADGDQHFDHRSLQEHRAPASSSDLYYKGALKGRSRAVYSGLIHIAKEAQKVDSWQANRNLILSEHAKADSIPYLEIEANDVRCSHAASVGPPDEEQLFYLESRGLDPHDAQHLIVKGFFQEILDRVRVPEVRDALEQAVEHELAQEDAPR